MKRQSLEIRRDKMPWNCSESLESPSYRQDASEVSALRWRQAIQTFSEASEDGVSCKKEALRCGLVAFIPKLLCLQLKTQYVSVVSSRRS